VAEAEETVAVAEDVDVAAVADAMTKMCGFL